MTTSGTMPRRTSSGSTSAMFPTSPTESASRRACAPVTSRSASSRSCAIRSQYAVSTRRRIRCSSTSTPRNAAPFIVAASGCAPPIPPSPAVTTSRPASVPPKCWRAHSANVS